MEGVKSIDINQWEQVSRGGSLTSHDGNDTKAKNVHVHDVHGAWLAVGLTGPRFATGT